MFSKTGVDQGTEFLLQVLESYDLSGEILDLGCGYGVIGIVLKTIFPDCSITSADINPRAVELTRENALQNGVDLTVIQSDGLEEIPGKYDVIVLNPPIRAGKKVIYRLFEDAYTHLRTNGKFVIVMRKKQGAESGMKQLLSYFGNCKIVDKYKGYWVIESTRLD